MTILDWCQSLKGVLKVSNLERGVRLRDMSIIKRCLSFKGVKLRERCTYILETCKSLRDVYLSKVSNLERGAHLRDMSIIKRFYLLKVSNLEGGVHPREVSIIKRCLYSKGVRLRERCTS